MCVQKPTIHLDRDGSIYEAVVEAKAALKEAGQYRQLVALMEDEKKDQLTSIERYVRIVWR